MQTNSCAVCAVFLISVAAVEALYWVSLLPGRSIRNFQILTSRSTHNPYLFLDQAGVPGHAIYTLGNTSTMDKQRTRQGSSTP
ncbi:hypothetical protein B0H67DRAFT_587380 [Lasiosphaeris hirsuta]|uniref:Secreted protein n=1 Tax=Lasiosphaeris hirsuta TaxID=260670 RepID=A0AA40DNJ2_9PEZI|nr:hypothetical protein B0H67DRAFT_587380 [Lasiosphaeris hirsuta]